MSVSAARQPRWNDGKFHFDPTKPRWIQILKLVAQMADNPRAKVLAATLDRATETLLNEDRSPTRKLGGIDNRGSHFYLALYWAQELARQTEDAGTMNMIGDFAGSLLKGAAAVATLV